MCRSAREDKEVTGARFNMKGSGSHRVNPITGVMVLPWQPRLGSMLSVNWDGDQRDWELFSVKTNAHCPQNNFQLTQPPSFKSVFWKKLLRLFIKDALNRDIYNVTKYFYSNVAMF